MPFVDELKLGSKLFALFVSRSGAGKTTATASFPEPNILDFDGRIRGLINSQHIYKQRIYFEQFLPPKGWDDIDKEIDKLDIKFQTNTQADSFYQSTLVIDSSTTFCNLMVNESLNIQTGGKYIKKDSSKKGLKIADYRDYNYEASAAYQFLNSLRSMMNRTNIIVTCHIAPRFGKPPMRDTKGEIEHAIDGTEIPNFLADNVEIGEKLSLRDKIEYNSLVFFDEVYRFEKRMEEVNGKMVSTFWVNFDTDLARSAIGLKGEHDITGKNFYEFWKQKVAEVSNQLVGV